MAKTKVIFYKDGDGTAPAYEAIRDLQRRGKRKEFAKCRIRIGRLSEMGHELRRPEAAYLRDDIFELRIVHRGVHYRMLYFFFGQGVAVLSHLITKEGKVPDPAIDLAIRRKALFEADPAGRTFRT